MISRSIFKSNDIRGVVDPSVPGVHGTAPGEWDLRGAHAIGVACAEELADLLTTDEPVTLVLGRDMRAGGEALSRAFIAGARQAGADVVDSGLSSTDQLWFASGSMGLPGVQLTASHNPAEYNGVKFCLPDAAPIDAGFLHRLAERALRVDVELAAEDPTVRARVGGGAEIGSLTEHDTLREYAAHLRSLVDLSGLRHLKVVVDAGNGMAGHTVHAVLEGLDIDLVGLYLELDGSFPHHPPNPLDPANLLDASTAVVGHRADLALVFDGDADRCFIIDEHGEVVSPSTITAMIATQELAREPGGTVVVNTVTSLGVTDAVQAAGGTVVVSPVGHTHVKAAMAAHDAVFGGEHSAHYYFREFWGADTGMLAALHVLGMVGHGTRPLSELAEPFEGRVASGELNSVADDQQAVMQHVARAMGSLGTVDHEDGMTLRGGRGADAWWVNLRPSGTEPLLRLNVEAADAATMERLRDRALALITEATGTQHLDTTSADDADGATVPTAAG